MEATHCTDEVLQQYLDGSLTEGRDRLEFHVRCCGECREQLEAYERVFAFARDEMAPGAADSGLARALSARVSPPREAAADRILWGVTLGLSAALLALCLTLVLGSARPAGPLAAVLGFAGMLALLAVKETRLLKRITSPRL